MKRFWKTALPFLVAAAVVLWWMGALDWFPGPASEPEPPALAPEPAPPSDEKRVPANIIQTDREPWPFYHGDAGLTGTASFDLSPPLTRLWSIQAKGPVYAAPVASTGAIFFNTSDGWVTAIDAQGAELWARQLTRTPSPGAAPVPASFDAPLACFDATLFLGSTQGTLYALHAATGDTRWTFDVGGPVLGTANRAAPADAGSRVIVIDQADGALQCLDAATGEPVWRTEEIDRCDGSPSVADDAIVFGSCAAALHVFSAAHGNLLRNIALGGDSQVAGGVALADGSAFSGSHRGAVFRVNVTTGEIAWTNQDADGEVFTTPAVQGGRVAFGSLDGALYGLDIETGKTVWRFETTGEPSSPVIAKDKLLFSSEGTLYMLRLDTGEELWSYEVSDYTSSPALVWGMVLVGSDDGTVTAFG